MGADKGELPDSTTFGQFMAYLRHRYRPADAARKAREQLSTMRQGGQGMNSYTDRFQSALIHIPHMEEGDQVHYYLMGLSPSIGHKVYEKSPATLGQAVEAAV